MKKNIIIVILAITSALSIIYGQYQKDEALKYEAAAIANQKRGEEMAMLAEQERNRAEAQLKIAMERAHEAMMQAELALAASKKHK